MFSPSPKAALFLKGKNVRILAIRREQALFVCYLLLWILTLFVLEFPSSSSSSSDQNMASWLVLILFAPLAPSALGDVGWW